MDPSSCVYEYIENGESDTVQVLQCITEMTHKSNSYFSDANTVLFLVYAASIVFLMQAGFAMVCSGSVRQKNVQNTMLKNLLDVCGSSLAFYFLGYGFAYGGDENGKPTFIGNSNFLLLDMSDDDSGTQYAHWLFEFAFAATSATIVAGALAERCQMNAYLYYSMLLTGFVYPVVAHNIWSNNGILTHKRRDPLLGVGVIDFAGSGVVHLTGGYTALIATWLLGPRKGRFFDQRGNKLPHPKPFPGHSKSLQMLGTFILWFGWYGFNAGSAIELGAEIRPAVIARTVVNTTLAGASAGIVSLFANLIAHERKTGEAIFKLSSLMNGCLAGLAAITGSCGVIEPWAAIVIGAIAGLLFWWSSNVLVKYCIDDAVDAIPVHLSGGMWGLIATGLFASPKALSQYCGDEYSGHVGWFYSFGRGSGDAALLACQIIALLFIVAWVSVIMFPFFLILNYLGIFRSDGLEELVGLDASYHDWTPIQVKDEVSNRHIREYMKQNNRKYYSSDSERSRTKSSEEADGDQDDGGVDRIEA